MPNQGKVRALAATLRLPNVPSVWSNTLTGVIFACMIQEGEGLIMAPLALLCATCLYFAGNLFNDWADLSWDQEHRPERALPSGIYQPGQYLAFGMLLTLIALAFAAIASFMAMSVSAALALFIVAYTWSHKRTAWGVVPMALCRASLPLLGYCACSGGDNFSPWIFLPASLLFSYLIMLSLRARAESRPTNSALMPVLTGLGFLLPIVILVATPDSPALYHDGLMAITVASIPYVIWTLLALTLFRKPIPRQISALLAGIPLLDAMFLLPYLLLGHLYYEQSLFWLVMAWLPAFVMGRLLQRYVPAT